MKSLVVLFCVLCVSVAQTATIDPVGAVTVEEGNNLTITCSHYGSNVENDFLLLENSARFRRNNSPLTQRNGTARIFHLPVDRTENGNTYRCENLITGVMSEEITVAVTFEPQVMVTNAPQNRTVTEGSNTTFNWMAEDKNGSPLLIGWRFTPSGSSEEKFLKTGSNLTGIEMVTVSDEPRTMLTFSGVRREADGGEVLCLASGHDPMSAFLSVQWPPVLSSEGRNITLREEESDTFNFTVDDVGNPPSTMTITGPSQPGNARVSISSEGVVSINGVRMDDAGTHTAMWRNDEGNATFTLDLNVISPLTTPSPSGTGTPPTTPTSAMSPEPVTGNVRAIVAGTVGGVVFLIIIGVSIAGVVVRVCWLKKKRSSEDDQVEMKKKRSSEDDQVEMKKKRSSEDEKQGD